MAEKREKWIDYIKVFACILVATGHFFMSMVESGILPNTAIHDYFIRTIYYFHVPLFFVCSGYLYQKKSKIINYSSWKTNVLEKVVTLGIPYLTFSVITWGLKAVFFGSVNSQNKGLLTTLFLEPSAPYWYLYILFFIFLVTPTFIGRKQAVAALLTAIALKYIQAWEFFEIPLYAINTTFDNLVWFVVGMCLCVFCIPQLCRTRVWKTVGVLCGILFLVVSCMDLHSLCNSISISFAMGVLGCLAVFLTALHLPAENCLVKFADVFSKYTMPIYLMHTIFAAGVRAMLMKLGFWNPIVHIVAGLMASFIGPIIAVWIMERLKLDILLYPGKYLKQKLN